MESEDIFKGNVKEVMIKRKRERGRDKGNRRWKVRIYSKEM